jgi:hypothetical protein
MTWKPDDGFHIEAFLERQGAPPPKKIELGKVGVIRKSDVCSIRMKPRNFDWAIAPNSVLIDRLDLLDENRLSMNLSCVILSASSRIGNDRPNWSGSALYETKSRLVLPDSVHREVWINDQKVESGFEASGIWCEDGQKQRTVGRLIDDRHLELHWNLSKSHWSKTNNWQWPEAAQDTLSMLSGQTIELLQREVYRGAKRYIEIRKREDAESLGLLSPFAGQERLDKGVFIRLTEFFVQNRPRAGICRNIFEQVVEAKRQRSRQATELLLSTILEAALRSIDGHPFRPRDKSWEISKSIKQFRQHYLSNKWTTTCDEVLKVYRRLRHRNAHPDWLFSQGGALSEEERAKSLDDMIFLSRFYGYMILALADFKDLEPRFPKPHKEWGAPVVIERTRVAHE